MRFFKKLFGNKNESNSKIPEKQLDFEILLNSEDTNNSIIEFDNRIGEICSYGDRIDILTKSQKIFYLNQNIEREVNNGGFNQFFLNSSGDFAQETIASLEKIGATKTADILREAINQFPGKNVPKNRNDREALIINIDDKINNKWEELDNIFYNYEEDLNQLNIEFISKNREDFENIFTV